MSGRDIGSVYSAVLAYLDSPIELDGDGRVSERDVLGGALCSAVTIDANRYHCANAFTAEQLSAVARRAGEVGDAIERASRPQPSLFGEDA